MGVRWILSAVSRVAILALLASPTIGGVAGSKPAAAADDPCPCSLFPGSTVPGTPSDPDGDARSGIEVGVQFNSDVAGFVSGIRFYKGSSNTGLHVGTIWDANGTVVSTSSDARAFAGETASGWQTLTFRQPVPLAAHTTYVAGYHSDFGFFSSDLGFFDQPLDASPLHATGGVYAYGGVQFPTSEYQGSNYWVDVLFDTHLTPAVTAAFPAPNELAVPFTSQPTSSGSIQATFDEPVVPSSVHMELRRPDGTLVPGTTGYEMEMPGPSGLFSPGHPLDPGTTYTLTVSGATDAASFTMAPQTWSFTTTRLCPCSVFPPFLAPETPSSGDAQAVELGMKFISNVAGTADGVRFYKSPDNTGTHVGELWTTDGQLLASVTFTGESDSGWQEAHFVTPVTLGAGNAYVVSYHTDAGNYSETDDGFQVIRAADFLPGFANGTALVGAEGSYAYGDAGNFPDQTYHNANYWVDVLFTPVTG